MVWVPRVAGWERGNREGVITEEWAGRNGRECKGSELAGGMGMELKYSGRVGN